MPLAWVYRVRKPDLSAREDAQQELRPGWSPTIRLALCNLIGQELQPLGPCLCSRCKPRIEYARRCFRASGTKVLRLKSRDHAPGAKSDGRNYPVLCERDVLGKYGKEIGHVFFGVLLGNQLLLDRRFFIGQHLVPLRHVCDTERLSRFRS